MPFYFAHLNQNRDETEAEKKRRRKNLIFPIKVVGSFRWHELKPEKNSIQFTKQVRSLWSTFCALTIRIMFDIILKITR